ncbi:MAG: hypothetical protein M1824_001860 [Vezdaea acicularis]|nr:MAG: hypothetical protein M1824_001860 [Vezdaea acicularis]
MPSSLAAASAVKALDSHTYSAFLPEDWCIGTVPHGGFLTTILMTASALHFRTTLSAQNQPHTLALHVDFLRRTHVGPATLRITDVKLGRQTSVIHISLSQRTSRAAAAVEDQKKDVEAEEEKLISTLTHTQLSPSPSTSHGPTLPTLPPLTPTPLPATLSLLPTNNDPNWTPGILPHPSFRKAAQHLLYHFPRDGPAHPSFCDEWIQLASGERFTDKCLGYVCDMWPQVVENYRSASHGDGDSPEALTSPQDNHTDQKLETGLNWYPTLLLNLEIKKLLPPEGLDWLFVRVRAKQIRNGRLDLEVVALDEEGEIVALSHHVCFVVGAERNLARREGGGGSGASKI